MNELIAEYGDQQEIHVILDNLSTHDLVFDVAQDAEGHVTTLIVEVGVGESEVFRTRFLEQLAGRGEVKVLAD